MHFLNRYQGVVIKKQDIQHYPFEEFLEATLEELEEVANKQRIQQYNSWMMPQMLAKFGQFKIIYQGEYIDVQKTLLSNLGSDPKLRGMYLVATKLPRGKLIQKQNSPQGSQYGALVPLIMAGIKKYQGIAYQKWPREEIKYLVDKNLAQAMMVEEVPNLSVERLLEIRTIGLTQKSGKLIGQQKSVTSTWALSGIQDTELGHLPKLAQTMLTQIWLAHPTLRNEYMVLDPVNWDVMPKPLIDAEQTTKDVLIVNTALDIPWM